MRFIRLSAIILCIVFIASCFANPTAFVTAGTEGLNLLYRAVLPVLFPFFFISGFIVNMSPNEARHGVLSAVLLSLFSGYPNGARLVGTLHAGGRIDERYARELCVLTSTPSPIFVVVSIGTVMLSSTLLGVLIFAATVIGAVLNWLLWGELPNFLSNASRCVRISVLGRGRQLNSGKRFEVSATTPCSLPAAGGALGVSCRTSKGSAPQGDTPPLLKIFNQSLTDAVGAILNVCGIILIFYIAAAALNAPPLASGIIEMTTGANAISGEFLPQKLRAVLICFVVSFGGMSVAMQSFIFMRGYNMSPLRYLAFKSTHAVLSTAVLSAILLLC